MKNRVLSFYYSVLSKQDTATVLTYIGAIISGWIGGLVFSETNNFWHWIALVSWVLYAILTGVVMRIARNFNEYADANKANATAEGLFPIDKRQIYDDSWKGINNDSLSQNMICRLLPQIWMPFTLITIPLLVVLGIGTTYCGNQLAKVEADGQKQSEAQKSEISIRMAIDSINTEGKLYLNMFKDSTLNFKSELSSREKEIDSLKSILKKYRKVGHVSMD